MTGMRRALVTLALPAEVQAVLAPAFEVDCAPAFDFRSAAAAHRVSGHAACLLLRIGIAIVTAGRNARSIAVGGPPLYPEIAEGSRSCSVVASF